MSRLDPSRVTLHRPIAVLACDSSATLEETLLLLRELDIHIKRVGPASIAFPREELPRIQRALHQSACFPRVIGAAPAPHDPADDA